MIKVYYYVCEDAEEVEGDEAEHRPVLRARGEEVRDAGFAAVVDGVEVRALGGRGGVRAVGE